jgi:hypothetical protein
MTGKREARNRERGCNHDPLFRGGIKGGEEIGGLKI